MKKIIKKALPKLLDLIMPQKGIKKFLKKDNNSLIHASKKSKTGYNVPELAMKYGNGAPKFALKTFLTIISTLKNGRKSYKDVKHDPVNPKTKASPEFIEEVIQYAKNIGALNVGFAKVKPKYIFKNSSILHNNAIVITMEMDKKAIEKAPSKETGYEVHKTYKKLGIIVNKIAEHLRENGYSAQAGPALDGDINYTLLAEKSGLGAIGNHGLLISPEVGPRQRIATVYTSIDNLPVKEKKEHIWIKSFCNSCKKCVKKCPSKAIYEEPQNDIHDTKKHIDYKKCAESFSDMYGCSICIKECTFNQTDYEKIKRSFKKINTTNY